jgi:hypothetical protein
MLRRTKKSEPGDCPAAPFVAHYIRHILIVEIFAGKLGRVIRVYETIVAAATGMENQAGKKTRSWFHIETQVVVLAIGFNHRQITDDLETMDADPALGRDDVPLITHGKSDVVDDDQRTV